MTDPKPYTPEEWAALEPRGVRGGPPPEQAWADLSPEMRARVRATVQALADAQAALDLVLQHGAEGVPHPAGDLVRVVMPWQAWEKVRKLWEDGGGNDRLQALLGIDDEEASDGTAARRQAPEVKFPQQVGPWPTITIYVPHRK